MADILRVGDKGEQVVKLQQALLAKLFNPGDIDGTFGEGTRSAVLAFQKSNNLLADGVAGPRTQKALGLAQSDALPDSTGLMSVQVASQMCPGAPLGNIKANLPIVLNSLSKFDIGHRPMMLMAVATIRAETGAFLPISEGRSKYNTSPSGHPFDLYDSRADLGNQGPPDGALFKGRGFIQLTGRYNYAKYGAILPTPIDLVVNPELANAASIAGDLLALFLSDKEVAIKAALLEGDLKHARRLVNGGSHGLDDFTSAYEIGNKLLPP